MNPLVRLYEAPVASLTDAAYALVLVAVLVATWYAAGRNALYLDEYWQETPQGEPWRYLIPFWYALRLIGLLIILAVDLLLVGGIIAVLT